MAQHDKALIINKTWATVIVAVGSAGLLGAFTTAWSANADMAVLKEDVRALKDAKLEPRVTSIEQGVRRMELVQTRMDDKLDAVLEKLSSRGYSGNSR